MCLTAHFTPHNLDETANWCPHGAKFLSLLCLFSACALGLSPPCHLCLVKSHSSCKSQGSSRNTLPWSLLLLPTVPDVHVPMGLQASLINASSSPHLLPPPPTPTDRLSTTEGRELYLRISRPPGLGPHPPVTGSLGKWFLKLN